MLTGASKQINLHSALPQLQKNSSTARYCCGGFTLSDDTHTDRATEKAFVVFFISNDMSEPLLSFWLKTLIPPFSGKDASQWLLTHLSPSCHRVNASRALPFPQTFIWMAQSPRRGRLLSSACEWCEWLFLIRPYNLRHKRWLFCTSCSVRRPRNTYNQRSPELKCPKGRTVNETQSIHRDS